MENRIPSRALHSIKSAADVFRNFWSSRSISGEIILVCAERPSVVHPSSRIHQRLSDNDSSTAARSGPYEYTMHYDAASLLRYAVHDRMLPIFEENSTQREKNKQTRRTNTHNEIHIHYVHHFGRDPYTALCFDPWLCVYYDE